MAQQRTQGQPPPYIPPPENPNPPDALVTFLYLLMRDSLPAGYVEQFMQRAITRPAEFSNPHLGDYAKEVAGVLTFDPAVHQTGVHE